MRYLVFVLLAGLIIFGACSDEGGTPKPRIYPRVDYPEGEYTDFQRPSCPFTFEMPEYVEIVRDSAFARFNPVHPCWFNIVYPMFQAEIYCSYATIGEGKNLTELKQDAFEIIDQINKRSDYMEEYQFKNEYGVGGVVFDFEGPAASPLHFFLTDTSTHFFKAALYFNTQVQPDSLAPVTRFIKEDIDHMLKSFQWQAQ